MASGKIKTSTCSVKHIIVTILGSAFKHSVWKAPFGHLHPDFVGHSATGGSQSPTSQTRAFKSLITGCDLASQESRLIAGAMDEPKRTELGQARENLVLHLFGGSRTTTQTFFHQSPRIGGSRESPRTVKRRRPREKLIGKGQMGSALMGSLQILCF